MRSRGRGCGAGGAGMVAVKGRSWKRLEGQTVEEKLLLNSRIDGQCWRWTRSHNPKGYGKLRVDRKVRHVHRFAYEIWVGPIPTWLEIDHRCRVRDCINPSHLEAVTHAENLRRGDTIPAINSRKTHCLRGHEFTPANIMWQTQNGRKGRHCRRCANDLRNARRAAKRARALFNAFPKTDPKTP